MIVVMAGNRHQFEQWIRENVMCITNKRDLEKIHGTTIDQLYSTGTYASVLSHDIIYSIMQHTRSNDDIHI